MKPPDKQQVEAIAVFVQPGHVGLPGHYRRHPEAAAVPHGLILQYSITCHTITYYITSHNNNIMLIV